MRKIAVMFLLAVFLPCLVLAWLALRSLKDQQFVLERQQALLHQAIADGIVKDIDSALAQMQSEFTQNVQAFITERLPKEGAYTFDTRLREAWPLAEVGFVVSLPGQILAPSPLSDPLARRFRVENDRFLCSKETVEVVWNSPKGTINLSQLDRFPAPLKGEMDLEKLVFAKKSGKFPGAEEPATETGEAEFRQLIGDAAEGTLARFLEDRLKLLFWSRAPSDPQLVFGAQLDLSRLTEALGPLVKIDPTFVGKALVALHDDNGKILASSTPVPPALAKPFVRSEIGEVLPHWAIAVYLLQPGQFTEHARALRFTMILLVAILLVAVSIGAWLISLDLRRQLVAARQKIDFVSNVSHELKTPLTSIRIFSELLAENRAASPDKAGQYLSIIASETARLTRLINNVLDFSKLERGEKKFQLSEVNLNLLVEEVANSFFPAVEAKGFQIQLSLPQKTILVRADRDALAQSLLNLLSNAEKYGAEGKAIAIELREVAEQAQISITDHGAGVPQGMEAKIFEQFFRAHDSLSNGIQGSGLGLTLARQIARVHGGDICYRPRPGGGAIFTLILPLPKI